MRKILPNASLVFKRKKNVNVFSGKPKYSESLIPYCFVWHGLPWSALLSLPQPAVLCFCWPFQQFACECSGPCQSFIARVATEFHTIFHMFCTLAFYESLSAQSDSPLTWRLTFPVKEAHCCFLIPLHPPLHKTMVSIASTEYIHSSERERQAGWACWLASQPSY